MKKYYFLELPNDIQEKIIEETRYIHVDSDWWFQDYFENDAQSILKEHGLSSDGEHSFDLYQAYIEINLSLESEFYSKNNFDRETYLGLRSVELPPSFDCTYCRHGKDRVDGKDEEDFTNSPGFNTDLSFCENCGGNKVREEDKERDEEGNPIDEDGDYVTYCECSCPFDTEIDGERLASDLFSVLMQVTKQIYDGLKSVYEEYTSDDYIKDYLVDRKDLYTIKGRYLGSEDDDLDIYDNLSEEDEDDSEEE